MTNLEVIQHLIGSNADVTSERLQISAQMLGVDPNAEFDINDSATKCKLYKAALQEIQQAKGVKSVTEGGYSITYADSSIPALLYGLAVDSGCDELISIFDVQPKIRNKSNMW